MLPLLSPIERNKEPSNQKNLELFFLSAWETKKPEEYPKYELLIQPTRKEVLQ